MSICFFINWIVDYGITRATPVMITEMSWGIFMLYAMLTYGGVVSIYFCLPELKGRSIESMDDLFQRPLWTMWKHAYPTEDEQLRHDVREMLEDGKIGGQEMGRAAENKATVSVHVENS